VNDDKDSTGSAHSQHDKSILVSGMIYVREQDGLRVVKDLLGLFEPNAMLSSVSSVFGVVPIEVKHI
jgi:hypothetical protein